jgi:alpha-1,3-rhamnosyl/mannosyltransferase
VIRRGRRCFDARKIDDTGIGRYVRNLLKPLLQTDMEHDYVVLLPTGAEPPWDVEAAGDRLHAVRENARNYSVRETVYLPLRLHGLRPTLVHEPHYTVPLIAHWRTVVTIQDVIHLRFPEYRRSLSANVYAQLMFRRAVASDRIIVSSESTRRDLIALLDADPARIRVTPFAADPSFRPITDLAIARRAVAAYGLTTEFFLYVGMWKPHKNLVGLLRAFAALVADGWAGKLAIVGPPDPRQPEIARAISDSGIGERVLLAGLVPDRDLPAFYSLATAVVLPSLYEGFGLTALEGMACGAPVIASDTSSIPEVVGDAALLVPPNDIASLARTMRAVARDRELRLRLTAGGPRQASRFSWERTAQQTLAVYDELDRGTAG